jgi:MFS family permease
MLRRARVARPLAGSLVGAFCIFANLVSGRITFAIGIAFGLACLLALGSNSKRVAYPLAAVLAVLCAGSSPVAGLFLLLCSVALVITGRVRQGIVLAVATLTPMLVIALIFGAGGWMQMTAVDAITGTVTSLAVAAMVTSKQIRVAAMLCVGGIILAYFVHTPVGSNAIRLPVMFALPLIVGLSDRSRWVVLLTGAIVAALNPPLVVSDLDDGGDPANYPSYYAALNAELAQQPHIGKIEVVMTPNYWESVYVARDHLLARGWLRQQDTAQNPLFFKNKAPSAAAYRRWLVDNGVAYVALPSEVSWLGVDERRAVHRAAAQVGPGSLRPIWGDAHWELYRVAASPGLVDGPVTVTRANEGTINLMFTRAGTALVRVNYNRWLSASGNACLADADGWTEVKARHAGPVEITSSLRPSRPARPC